VVVWVLWADMKPRNPDAGNDPLLDLQLRVARRADAIATGQPKMPGLDLHCWLVAEREVFGGGRSEPMTAPRPEEAVVPAHR
jgi:hypothetical protein